MRDVLDCGVLLAPGHEAAMSGWVDRHPVRVTRLRLHLVPLDPPRLAAAPGIAAPEAPEGADVRALARLAVALKRYDACILPVAPASLSWTRMALQQAGAVLSTPVLLLVHDVKAPAIEDLLGLGAWDFMMQPACLESLRVRLGRLARPAAWRDARLAALREPAPNYSGSGYPGTAPAGPNFPSANSPAAGRPAVAGHAQHGGSRPRVPADVVEQALSGLRHQHQRGLQESFRMAKARVVEGFERDYIRLALSRHAGNVAQAARACCKHRRAFWALMRKHGIEAAPYRQAAQERDG
ncbi:hypothetical protein [Achromobacter denitrificans]|uniref:hypothetical protein n=1 Tax=Achromobacter denitrificans TaxID=32002 RepID=UPI0023E7A534|nr:hypothetical protein [Achromobacter denitrificans]MDF3851917.1 hypothetical protein [Achromobacter denitrificans]